MEPALGSQQARGQPGLRPLFRRYLPRRDRQDHAQLRLAADQQHHAVQHAGPDGQVQHGRHPARPAGGPGGQRGRARAARRPARQHVLLRSVPAHRLAQPSRAGQSDPGQLSQGQGPGAVHAGPAQPDRAVEAAAGPALRQLRLPEHQQDRQSHAQDRRQRLQPARGRGLAAGARAQLLCVLEQELLALWRPRHPDRGYRRGRGAGRRAPVLAPVRGRRQERLARRCAVHPGLRLPAGEVQHPLPPRSRERSLHLGHPGQGPLTRHRVQRGGPRGRFLVCARRRGLHGGQGGAGRAEPRQRGPVPA